MNDEVSVYDYASPVQKVLMEPNVLLGIGVMPAVFIMVFTIVLMNLVSIWAGTIGIILFLIAKKICKKDAFMLEILFERLSVPDCWRA